MGAPKWFKDWSTNFEKKNDVRWEEFHDFKEKQKAFNKNQEAFNKEVKTFMKTISSLPTIKKELNELD